MDEELFSLKFYPDVKVDDLWDASAAFGGFAVVFGVKCKKGRDALGSVEVKGYGTSRWIRRWWW